MWMVMSVLHHDDFDVNIVHPMYIPVPECDKRLAVHNYTSGNCKWQEVMTLPPPTLTGRHGNQVKTYMPLQVLIGSATWYIVGKPPALGCPCYDLSVHIAVPKVNLFLILLTECACNTGI